MSDVDLVAVQLEIGEAVLASADEYRRTIEDAAARAVPAGGGARLLVFPEVAGHLALYALSPRRGAKTLAAALGTAAVRRPLDVLRGIVTSRVLDPRHAVLAALAPDGEKFWRGVFGPLARKHDAYVVAGSHLRLSPDGALTNASMLFAPDGRLLATTDKVNLIPGVEDGAPGALGLARGSAARVPIVDTPIGKLCTLICYDGFAVAHTAHERFEPCGERIAARGGAAIVANPAANPWRWAQPWPPRKLADAPARYPTRAEQWQREGLAASLAERPFARYGVTAHLVGHVLDLHFDGASEILVRDDDGVRTLARCADASRGGHVTARVAA